MGAIGQDRTTRSNGDKIVKTVVKDGSRNRRDRGKVVLDLVEDEQKESKMERTPVCRVIAVRAAKTLKMLL